MRIFKRDVYRKWRVANSAAAFRHRGGSSSSVSKSFRQPFRQTGCENLLLRPGNIVIQPTQLNGAFVHVINDISGLGIVITRLADRPHVYEVFLAGFDFELRVSPAAH